jgi:hypothetical protein
MNEYTIHVYNMKSLETATEVSMFARTEASEHWGPDLETEFSQARRNGRAKGLEEFLYLGFPINGEDGKENTLLLISCQQN